MSGNDRISALHDTYLDHILSYLPTEQAVQTSVLSKRWNKVWASVPVLEYDFSEFWRLKHGTLLINEHSECHENFVRLIDAVLASRRGQQIDRFTLVWKYQIKEYQDHDHPVRRWISLVLVQSPRVLSIYVQPSDAYVDVPDMAFTCSSLEEMKLQVDQEYFLEVLEPKLVNLPSLKRLNLGYFTITADFMSKLLLGCPKLEELELYACGLNFSQIYCGNLKSLVLNGCCILEEIRVSIPSLQYLKVTIMSSDTAEFAFENMSSLVKASVCFFTEHVQRVTQFYNSEAKILNNLLRVTNLDVVLHGSEAVGMLKHALNNCPYFENLKAVHFENFDGCLIYSMDMIECLVQHSPILENLTFYCCEDLSDEFKKKLRKIVCEHENCQLVESKQGHIYESLDEIEELLHGSMRHVTETTDDDDEEAGGGGVGGGGDDVVGGEAGLAEEEEEEGDVEQ
ncbi:F-box/LRR-repeat protein At3g58900-like [Carex rostrata]